ncbi:MAG: urease accessory protein UreF [Termitinemataceae bacterium]|nr:MAG: urease accessory protein UreF [Termitinemataceae bacterium]
MNTNFASPLAGAWKFLLLQMNDALFPIGAFAHSYGLETYIQNGLVYDVPSADQYLRSNLTQSFLYGDLLCAALAWDRCAAGDLSGLLELENMVWASKAPAEIRDAAQKLGSRFIKTVSALLPALFPGALPFLADYADTLAKQGVSPSHAGAYGVCCGVSGIPKAESLRAFLYAQASAMVTCCVKTIPISQTAGQGILTGLFDCMVGILDALESLEAEDLYRTCAGFDLRCMEHEILYSRLFMS